MTPRRKLVEQFLDKLSFGPYIINDNDCDVMAQAARDTMAIEHPEWEHGMHIMFGFFIPQAFIVGHGIAKVKCREGGLYYDCTTESGDDGTRYRDTGWMKGWLHYAMSGYILFWWYTQWGDYEPSKRFDKIRKMTPWWLYGTFYRKLRRLPVRH